MRPMQKNDRRKVIIPTDRKLREACISLRDRVEHPNEVGDILLQGGIYRQKDLEAILTIKVDGVEVGYKVKESSALEMNPFFDRYVYLKIPGYKLDELTNKQLASIKTALYDAFLEPQQSPIGLKIIGEDALLMTQRFQVAFLYEKNKGLVTLTGGVNLKEGKVIQ